MSRDSSESALDDFVKYWGRMGKFPLRGEEIEIFPAVVAYFCRGKERTIKTTVHLYFERHKIEIIPLGWLDTEFFYTGFDPAYQSFGIEAGHVLRVTGSGPKVGGAYHVDILPE